jgi:hypothetical protein
MPIHWGTFALAMHAWDEPAETLLSLGRARGTPLVLPMPGEAVEPVDASLHAREIPWPID